MIERERGIRVLTYKAIADKDEDNRMEGEPLFPEHKSLKFLEDVRVKMAAESWESLYQQSPIITGGNIFKDEYWKWYKI